MPSDARYRLLRDHQLFAACDDITKARILPHLSERDVTAGEQLLAPDAPLDEIVFPGTARLVFTGQGAGQGTGVEVCGEETLLGFPTCCGELTAAASGRIYTLPARVARHIAASCPGLAQQAAHCLAQRLSAAHSAPAAQSAKAQDAPAGSLREVIGWLAAIVVPATLLFLLRHDPSLPDAAPRHFLAILSCVGVMWMFRLLPDFIPVLFALLALVIFGVAPATTILSGFATDSFFMAMSVLALGTVIHASGLGFRILLLLLGARPSSRWWHNFCVFLVGLVLTPIIPSANGRIAIVSPFVRELLGSLSGATRDRAAARLTVSALAGASIFSAIFLSSKSINFLMFGYLPAQEQLRFQWTYWLVAAAVAGLVLLLFFLVSWSLVFRTEEPAQLSRQTIQAQLALLGPLSEAEIAALAGIAVFAVGLATTSIHRIELPWLAVSIMFGLLMFGFLDRRAFRRSIDWSFLFFLGGLIGIVRTMHAVGADEWLAGKCAWLTWYMVHDLDLFILLLAGSIFVVRLILPINATAVIFLTLLMPAAQASGVNPWIVGFMVLFLAETWLFPYQASYYLQYCSLTGQGHPGQDRRLVPFHFAILLMKIAAIYASLPWWRFLGLL